MTIDYISYIEKAINNSNNYVSKLDDKIFDIPGMSSKKIRILLNNLLSENWVRYMEIGCWKGSTLCSAMYNNNPNYCCAIDNFSEFGSPKKEFLKNTASYINTNFDFFDDDCFGLDISKIKSPINIYFYDGQHTQNSQRKALTYFYPILDHHFVYICDDWSRQSVKQGTLDGISEANLKIIKDWELISDRPQCAESWWNDLYVAYISK